MSSLILRRSFPFLASAVVLFSTGCGSDAVVESSGAGAGGSGAGGGGAGVGGASSGGGGSSSTTTASGGGSAQLTAAHCPTPEAGHPAGTLLYVGGGGTEGRTAVTLDGADWTDVTTTSYGTIEPGHTRNLIRGAGYGGGVFVMVGGHDNSYISTSCDGVNWRQDVLGTNVDGAVPADYDSFLSDVAYLDGVFVAAGGAGKRLTSTDHGLSWVSTGDYASGHFRGIAAGNGVFVATGHDWGGGNGLVSVSTDGQQWSEVATSAGELGQVVFGNGVFVSIGLQRCAVSADGMSWSDCNTGLNSGQTAVHFVNGQFYMQFTNGYWGISGDGQSWAMQTAGYLPEVVAEGNGLFVGSRWGARGYSTDMQSWTEIMVPPEWGLRGLAAGEVLYAP